jgi:hypothetical protein
MAILPLAALLGILITLRLRAISWRESFLISCVLWSLLVAVTTELFSVEGLLTRSTIAGAWAAVSVVAWAAAGRALTQNQALQKMTEYSPSARNLFRTTLFWEEKILVGFLGVVLGITVLIAVISPPNIWDAMQYNMPRVVMWMENHSVHFYPTIDYQQLTMSPWCDFAMMHLALLQGNDRLVNLVQWFAFLGSIFTVSLIAKELGAGRRGQLLSAILCGTIPHGILAASSAKPDLAVGFWIVASAYFLLRYRAVPSWANAMFAACSIGLAILTKGTAYLLLPVIFVAIFCIWTYKVRRTFLSRAPVVLLVVLCLNAPQFVRNYHLAGSPLGFASPGGDLDAEGQRNFATGKHGPRDIAANVVRNFVLHLAMPSDKINAWTERQTRRLIWTMGVNPDDQAMMEGHDDGRPMNFSVPSASRLEVFAGNFLHLVLFLVTLLLLLFNLRSPDLRDTIFLSAGVLGSFVFFCAGLRWQFSIARFHLPLFMLACGIMGTVLGSRLSRIAVLLLSGTMVLGSLPYLFLNQARPLLNISYIHHGASPEMPTILTEHRENLYFADQHSYLADSYIRTSQAILASGCGSVGLDASLQHYEYPLLALLKVGVGGPNVYYIDIQNRSAVYKSSPEPSVCAVVCLGCALARQKRRQYGQLAIDSLQFDRNLIFLYSHSIDLSRQTASDEPLKEQRMTRVEHGTLSLKGDLGFVVPGESVCKMLSEDALHKVLGPSVKANSTHSGCVYESSIGYLEITVLSTTSQARPQIYDIATEGVGSLQANGEGQRGCIILDHKVPLLEYVRRDHLTLSLNLDRTSPSVTAEDFRFLTGELNWGVVL